MENSEILQYLGQKVAIAFPAHPNYVDEARLGLSAENADRRVTRRNEQQTLETNTREMTGIFLEFRQWRRQGIGFIEPIYENPEIQQSVVELFGKYDPIDPRNPVLSVLLDINPLIFRRTGFNSEELPLFSSGPLDSGSLALITDGNSNFDYFIPELREAGFAMYDVE